MKAIVYERSGSPDVLEYREVEDPVVTKDSVLIRMKAISIEGGDLIHRASFPFSEPYYVGGYQRAGVIEAIGDNVKGLQVGQRVAAFNWRGAYGELSCVPAHYVYPIPEDMDFKAAVTIPVTFGTAAQSILVKGNLAAGETILITGATGGVGLAAVQLAKSVGATVIGTSSSDENLQRLKQYGMDYGINYKTENIGKRCQAITNKKGVDFAMDNIGGNTISAIVAATAIGGRISVVGTVADPIGSNYNSMSLIQKQLSARGIFFGREMHKSPAHKMIKDLLIKVNEGKFAMPIDKQFSLANAADAHRYIESDKSLFGRVVLTP